MASALFQFSVNGGSTWLPVDTAVAGGQVLTYDVGTADVRVRLASTAGLNTPPTWSVTAKSSGASTLTITHNADKSATIPISRATPTTYLLRCVVNGGSGLEGGDTKSLALKVATGDGLELLAPGEEDEADRAFGWVGAINSLVLAGGGGGGGGGSATRLRANANAYISGDISVLDGLGAEVVENEYAKTLTINTSRFRAGAAGTGAYFFGDVSLIPGAGFTIAPDTGAKTFTFASTQSIQTSGGSAFIGAAILAAGTGITIVESPTGTFEFSGFALPSGYTILTSSFDVECKLGTVNSGRGLLTTLNASLSVNAQASTARYRATSTAGLDEEVFRWGVDAGVRVAKRLRVGSDTNYQYTETFAVTTTVAIASVAAYFTFTPPVDSTFLVTVEAVTVQGTRTSVVIQQGLFKKFGSAVTTLVSPVDETPAGMGNAAISSTIAPSGATLVFKVGQVSGTDTNYWTVNVAITYLNVAAGEA